MYSHQLDVYGICLYAKRVNINDRVKRVDDFFCLYIKLTFKFCVSFYVFVRITCFTGRLTTTHRGKEKKIIVYNFGLGLKANLFFASRFLLAESQTKVKQIFFCAGKTGCFCGEITSKFHVIDFFSLSDEQICKWQLKRSNEFVDLNCVCDKPNKIDHVRVA